MATVGLRASSVAPTDVLGAGGQGSSGVALYWKGQAIRGVIGDAGDQGRKLGRALSPATRRQLLVEVLPGVVLLLSFQISND